jgi:SNF2 family DNA or RNA helicase
MSRATDATLTHLPSRAPALAATLRPDQRAGAAWVAAGYRGAGLLADKPGLGKTLETIAGLLEKYNTDPFSALIICPKVSVKNVWGREWAKWGPGVSVHQARGTRAQREKVLDAFLADATPQKVLVIVAEMTRIQEAPACTCGKPYVEGHEPGGDLLGHFPDINNPKKMFSGFEYPQLFARPWDAIVVDESQRWMGSLTIVKGTLAGKGFKRLEVAQNGLKLAVSATPFGKGGRVQGMFGTLHWLWPDEFTSFWRWAERYFEIEEQMVSRSKTVKRIVGLSRGANEEEFLRSLGPRIMRRTKEEVLPNLPPKQFVEVLCEMAPRQAKQYAQLSSDAEVRTPGGMIVANGTLAEITRAKQIACGEITLELDAFDRGTVRFTGESGKLEALWEKLEARGIISGDGDGKLIISSQFNELLAVLRARLDGAGVAYHVLTGATSDSKRDQAMDTFQGEGGPRVFLLNAKAGGVSITLDAADEVHCLDELWNPEDQEQLEDRAHRASRIHQVTIYHYRTEDSIDQNIAEDVEAKRLDQHAVLDGRRGLAYARDLIRQRGTRRAA